MHPNKVRYKKNKNDARVESLFLATKESGGIVVLHTPRGYIGEHHGRRTLPTLRL